MTREEAIYLLNNLRSVAEGKEDEAIDMAISALQGGDAKMDNCQAQAPQNYMQQSRQAEMMLVDLNSKDGYLLDGKYKVNGCEDLTDGRVEVVRCKDCRFAHECHKSVQFTHNEPRSVTIGYTKIDFCSHGERKEP